MFGVENMSPNISVRKPIKERLEQVKRDKGFTAFNDVIAYLLEIYVGTVKWKPKIDANE